MIILLLKILKVVIVTGNIQETFVLVHHAQYLVPDTFIAGLRNILNHGPIQANKAEKLKWRDPIEQEPERLFSSSMMSVAEHGVVRGYNGYVLFRS